MKTKIFTIIALVLILSLNINAGDNPNAFDYGKVENNKYSNSYFDFSLSVPEKWFVQSKEETDRLMNQGKDILAGDDKNLKAVLNASDINSAYLLTVFQFQVGSPVDFNPSFMVIAENLKSFPGIKNGSDYLFQTRRLLKQSQLVYNQLDAEFKPETIASKEFYTMNSTMNYMGVVIKQKYYSAIIKGFSFNIIVSYVTDEQKAILDAVLRSLKFGE